MVPGWCMTTMRVGAPVHSQSNLISEWPLIHQLVRGLQNLISVTDNGFSVMVLKRKAETLWDIKIKEGDPNDKRRKY
jgi:hypothetical protein